MYLCVPGFSQALHALANSLNEVNLFFISNGIMFKRIGHEDDKLFLNTFNFGFIIISSPFSTCEYIY